MKKEVVFLVFAMFFLAINITSIKAIYVTGEATKPVNMNISVFGPPTLTIISPKNETYMTNTSILLSYIKNEGNVWYHLDNLSNISITQTSILFNTSKESHTLYLYANNSYGITQRNISFSINSTKFVIIDDEFEENEDVNEENGQMNRNQKKGSSTDFLNYTYEELQNLSNIILEDTDFGKINFLETINLTDDENPNDNSLNLNNNINVSWNRIEINSSSLSNFNKSATLFLYNLNFTTPRILKDGSLCPASICARESYTNNILKFNATGFSVYSSEETPSSDVQTSPSGGGGGGKKITSEATIDFSVDVKEIKISLKQGETKERIITIKNKGEKINFSISIPEELKNFIKIEEKTFTLNSNEEKIIKIDFLAKEDAIPDLYIGKLGVISGNTKEEILIVVEIESKKSLLDINVEIPKKYTEILLGEEITFYVELYNLGQTGRVDVELEYIIKNEKNEIITSETETIAIEIRTSHIKTIEIPANINTGQYVIYVKAKYNGDAASSTEWFKIIEKPFLQKYENLIIVLVTGLIVLTILAIIWELKRVKLEKSKSKRRK